MESTRESELSTQSQASQRSHQSAVLQHFGASFVPRDERSDRRLQSTRNEPSPLASDNPWAAARTLSTAREIHYALEGHVLQISLEALSDFGFDTFWHDMEMRPRPSLNQMRSLQTRLVELFRMYGPDRMEQCVRARQLRAWLGIGFEWVRQPAAIEKFPTSAPRHWPSLDDSALKAKSSAIRMPTSVRMSISSLVDEGDRPTRSAQRKKL